MFAFSGEMTNEKDKVYTEEDWTNPDSPQVEAYSKSKTLAEKAAWEILERLPGVDDRFVITFSWNIFLLATNNKY